MADYILVVDRMERFFDNSPARTGLFFHAYASICNDIGLDVVEMEAMLAPGSPYGYFLARGVFGRLNAGKKVCRLRMLESFAGPLFNEPCPDAPWHLSKARDRRHLWRALSTGNRYARQRRADKSLDHKRAELTSASLGVPTALWSVKEARGLRSVQLILQTL